MDQVNKKAAIAAYKERKASAGIYAVRCVPTGDCWIGRAPDLGTIQNRLWFGLKLGSSPHRGLQAAWHTHGADQFTFEELERLADEELPYVREATLKRRLAYWREMLNAVVI